MVSDNRARTSLFVRFCVAMTVFTAMSGILAGSAFAASVKVRVEGATNTVFTGVTALGTRNVVDSSGVAHAQTSNALSALDAAAQLGSFPFVLDNTAYGLYVSSVAGELPVPNPPYPGWSYRVNGIMPAVGADQYALKAGDSVLWYYGTWDASPTVAWVPRSYVAVGTTATVAAKQLDPAGVASSLPSATVTIGRNALEAGADGTVRMRFTTAGDYGVRVAKEGLIRSDIRVIKVRHTTRFSAISASRTTVPSGTRVKLTGKLSGAGKTPSGRIVKLWSRKAGTTTWVLTSRAYTGSTGGFTFYVKPTRSTYYRTSFSQDSVFASSVSASRLIRVTR